MSETATARAEVGRPSGKEEASPRGPWAQVLRVWPIALPAVAYGTLAWLHRWTSDDGFIFFRVVDELLHGHGPVFNGGERVEAATGPLWVGILAVARLVSFKTVRLEYLALWLSLAGAVFGLVAACLGGLRVARASTGRSAKRAVVPFGALVVVGVAGFWDFATSGLEMGLVFAWMGACFWALIRFVDASPGGRRPYLLAILLGLGPVIRPDLALFSIAFLAAELIVERPMSIAARLGHAAIGIAIPVLYQIFRMGYYAAVVPNTAIAKGASSSQWDRGYHYLRNLISSYRLEAPLILIVIMLIVTIRRLWRTESHGMVVVILATLLAGFAHGLYIVMIGGDFFHARLLLPALFAFLMPVSVITLTDGAAMAIGAAITLWAVVSAAALRPLGSDQRAFYVHETHHSHPVTLDDYRNTDAVRVALEARRDAQLGRRLLVIPTISTFYIQHGQYMIDFGRTVPLRRDIPQRAGLAWTGIGALSYAAGDDVFIVDRLGLGDPIGSRLTGFPSYFPVGHEKYISVPWVEARAAAPDTHDTNALGDFGRQVALEALRCGSVRTLLRDVRGSLSPGRFAGNVVQSFGLTTLRIPQAPLEARKKFCG